MNTLINALKEENNTAFTENGAVAKASTLNPIVDFFTLAPNCLQEPDKAVTAFKIAYAHDRRMALRTLLWSRDVRGGAGARAPYRACLRWLAEYDIEDSIRMVDRTSFIGRWDDLLSLFDPMDIRLEKTYSHVLSLIQVALDNNDFLCAKWMPRKGKVAALLAARLNHSPKSWRKTLVNICSQNFLVETQMCSNEWNDIKYSAVPSVAFSRYKKAFSRHDEEGFAQFLSNVSSGKEEINSSVVFPHDIIRDYRSAGSQEQWNCLPNYLEGENTGIVVADVSGSMDSLASGSVTNMDISISLAIYMAERARGPFKDHFITFSEHAEFVHIPSTLSLKEKVKIAKESQWDVNTNIQSVFNLILNTALTHKIVQKDMPKFITIVSDMQFDSCGRETNLEVIRAKYAAANYQMPTLVFWNVAGYASNKPATIKDPNIVLISGFSPAILKNVFTASSFDVMKIFLNTVLNPRYDFEGCKVKVNNEI